MRDDVKIDPELAPPLDAILERCRGVAEIGFAPTGADGASCCVHLYQESPSRVFFPRVEEGDPISAVLVTTSGGLTGGDSLRILVGAQAGTSALVTTQAAEKIYRSIGSACTIDVALEVDEGAWLEWLPQETILFNRTRLKRRNSAVVAAGGRLLAAEMLVFGRTSHGERFEEGYLDDSWRVRFGGRLAWADAILLEGDIARQLDHPAGFGGAAAIATIIYVADDAANTIETARRFIERSGMRAGASVVNGVLLTRFLGRDTLAVRRDLARFIAGFRAVVGGLPARLPRVWAT